MNDRDIAAYARTNLEPVRGPFERNAYRCAAYLHDGVYLPCVLIGDKAEWVRLALRRFEEEKVGPRAGGYTRSSRASSPAGIS